MRTLNWLSVKRGGHVRRDEISGSKDFKAKESVKTGTDLIQLAFRTITRSLTQFGGMILREGSQFMSLLHKFVRWLETQQ